MYHNLDVYKYKNYCLYTKIYKKTKEHCHQNKKKKKMHIRLT